MRTIIQIAFAALALMLTLCGCGRNGAPASADSGKPPSAIGRIFGTAAPPAYRWNGQASSVTLACALETAVERAGAALRALKFEIAPEQTKRQADSATLQAKRGPLSATLTLRAMSPASTEVTVQIGTVGDRNTGERILEEIERTGKAAPGTANGAGAGEVPKAPAKAAPAATK